MFIVFGSFNYYPSGGIRDIMKVVAEGEDLKPELIQLNEDYKSYDEWQVLNTSTLMCVVSNNINKLIDKIENKEWVSVEDYRW